jgi:hypothetical protein
MEHKLLVPVRTTAAGTLALRTGRLSSGERTGLAFTCQDALVRALGPSQQWTDLSWEALLDMVAPLGIEHIRVDPEPDHGAIHSALSLGGGGNTGAEYGPLP